MNYIYESYFKTIKGEKHFFVKKYLRLDGIGEVSDIMEGYGMLCLLRRVKSIGVLADGG